MNENASETDRIVVVGAGFGVWMNNRHVASARWSDVVELRASVDETTSPSRIGLVVVLQDDNVIAINDNVSGYRSFLAAAESSLSGLRHPSSVTAGETILFARKPGR